MGLHDEKGPFPTSYTVLTMSVAPNTNENITKIDPTFINVL